MSSHIKCHFENKRIRHIDAVAVNVLKDENIYLCDRCKDIVKDIYASIRRDVKKTNRSYRPSAAFKRRLKYILDNPKEYDALFDGEPPDLEIDYY